jgi:transposase
MRGEKGVPHLAPEDPPRRRANKIPGHGSWENDRTPVCGVVGRESGELRLTVTERSDRETLQRVVMWATWPMVTVNTDEWGGYNGLPAMGRSRPTVCHAEREWARDDDGDGVREVHLNTMEGMCGRAAELPEDVPWCQREVPVPVRRDVEWGYNVKRATQEFLWALLGVRSATT